MVPIGNSIYLWVFILGNSWYLSDGYKRIHLQDYLCSDKLFIALQTPFRGYPAFTLTEDRDSAAIITQEWNTTLPGYHSLNKIKYDCHFKVQTPPRPPRGIYTVITHLKFRHDPVTGDCIDYIQFERGNRSPSEKICNDISVDGPAGRLIFDERASEVSVHVHIDRNHMIVEPLELRMVLTAHSECRYTTDFLCEPNNKYSCISRHFVRDNITNCMYPCRDEVSCFHDITMEEIDTANVAISAITSLIFTMLGVGFCVWICWKYWNCITVQQHAHEASAAAHRGQRDTHIIELPNAPAFEDVITASLEQEVSNQQQQQQPPTPKDLPPSYESLFPDR